MIAALAGLFQIPQRYRFSSKSQHIFIVSLFFLSCFRYHKGTDFQANHNIRTVSSSSDKGCFRYHKGTDFQANHNRLRLANSFCTLFQIPQRYRFSSKSQHLGTELLADIGCFRYHKGTDFQANHNRFGTLFQPLPGCFRYHKGTDFQANHNKGFISSLADWLFQIPQRYRFSSKSQLNLGFGEISASCFRYHKGTDFQANHNYVVSDTHRKYVVLDTTKVQIFKQITTKDLFLLLLIGCFRYHKGTDFQANHN